MPAEAGLFFIHYKHGSLHCFCSSVSGGASPHCDNVHEPPQPVLPLLEQREAQLSLQGMVVFLGGLHSTLHNLLLLSHCSVGHMATGSGVLGRTQQHRWQLRAFARQRASGTCCICLVSDEAHKRTEAGGKLPCDSPLSAVLVHPGKRGAATISPILALVPKVVGIEGLSAAASAPASSPAQHSMTCCFEAMLDSCVAVCIVHFTPNSPASGL